MSTTTTNVEWQLRFKPDTREAVGQALLRWLTDLDQADPDPDIECRWPADLTSQQMLIAAVYVSSDWYITGVESPMHDASQIEIPEGDLVQIDCHSDTDMIIGLFEAVAPWLQFVRGGMGTSEGEFVRFGLCEGKMWAAWPCLVYPGDPNYPTSVLCAMTQLDDPDVLLAIAENPHAPGDVLVQLMANDNHTIREAALSNQSLPEEYRILNAIA